MNRKEWEAGPLDDALGRHPERRERFETSSGIPVDRLATPESLDAFDPEVELGYPGTHPYVRGIQPSMYRGRLWTMRQYAGFASARESNERFRELLAAGTTGLSVAFDLPTQMGFDSDDPMSAGEVGRVGVAIDCLDDMETLFDEIPLEKVSTSMTINATAAILLAFYVAVARRRGLDPSCLRGTIQNDILKEYFARGTYIFPPGPSMRIVTDIFSWCADEVPLWNTISVSGYHIRESGSTAVQELAFTLADGIQYVEAAVEAGLDVDVFAPRISFFFNSQNDLFEEVAKFRAARRLWAEIMRDRFGAKDPRSCKLRFHAQTSGASLQAQQPHNNVVRVALQALGAVFGGCQSLHTNGFDEALGLPTAESATLALRTQQVIAHESGVTVTVDPLGGSWHVEAMTRAVETEVRSYLSRIEEMGGAVAAIESGFFRREIEESAYRAQKRAEEADDVIVGVNQFQDDGDVSVPVSRIDPAVGEAQAARVKSVRARRDQRRALTALDDVESAAKGGANLMPSLVTAAESDVTLGEICGRLRNVFGSHRPT